MSRIFTASRLGLYRPKDRGELPPCEREPTPTELALIAARNEDRARPPKPARMCACGRAFFPQRDAQRYCGRGCAPRPVPPPAPRETRACRTCGSEFECRVSAGKRYCSPACGGRAKLGQPPSSAAPRVAKTCPVCQETFSHPPFRNPQTCSRKCSDQRRRKP